MHLQPAVSTEHELALREGFDRVDAASLFCEHSARQSAILLGKQKYLACQERAMDEMNFLRNRDLLLFLMARNSNIGVLARN
jgi:hypothetical protein